MILENKVKNILIASAWPYAHNVPHLGNLLACLLSGCVFTRYYRMKGYNTLHVSGTDAHGTRIEYEAQKAGLKPEELASQVHGKILNIIEAFNIQIDNYTTTESPVHKEFVQQIHKQMDRNGYIKSKEEKRAYCTECEKFLADRFIEGECPQCGYREARGNQCDNCGALLEPEELINPRCAFCNGKEITFKNTKHWYLDLEKLAPKLKEYVGARDWEGNVKRFTQSMIDQGLKPRAITRDIKWGIPAPFEGAEGKVIYVWAEAALGYVSATIEYFKNKGDPEEWKTFWFGEDIKQVYTQAKDNIPFHALIFPGQLIASSQGYHLPDQISAIEYMNWIDGKAFSKSKGIGLYCDDALQLLDPVYWRFYLLYSRPEKRDINFSWNELEKSVNGVFVDNISNFVNRVVSFINSSHESMIPEASTQQNILKQIKETKATVENLIEDGHLAPALKEIAGLSVVGNEYFQKEKPWEGDKPQVVVSALHLVKAISIMLYPFVPSFSEKVFKLLKINPTRFEAMEKIETGRPVGKARALLGKIDIDQLKSQYDQLKKTKEEKKAMIPFEQFQKMDIKVGKVVEVEDIEGSDKLYKLSVDVGKDRKLSSVAGLKNHYSKEVLLNKKAVVLTNLEPATLFGQKSECMLLAAEGKEGKVSLLQTDSDMQIGSKVK